MPPNHGIIAINTRSSRWNKNMLDNYFAITLQWSEQSLNLVYTKQQDMESQNINW